MVYIPLLLALGAISSVAAVEECSATYQCHVYCGGMAKVARTCGDGTTYTGPFNSTCLCGSDSEFIEYVDECLECGWSLWSDYGTFLTAALAECSYTTEPTGSTCTNAGSDATSTNEATTTEATTDATNEATTEATTDVTTTNEATTDATTEATTDVTTTNEATTDATTTNEATTIEATTETSGSASTDTSTASTSGSSNSSSSATISTYSGAAIKLTLGSGLVAFACALLI